MSTFVPWNADLARARVQVELETTRKFLVAEEPAVTALLPILHALQHEFGFIHDEAVPLLASALNVSKAEVRGVISFYSDFRTTLPTGPVIKLCRAEACQAVGCERVAEHVAKRWPNATVDSVYCLGNCALGPAALVGERLVGRLDEAKVDRVLEDAS